MYLIQFSLLIQHSFTTKVRASYKKSLKHESDLDPDLNKTFQ